VAGSSFFKPAGGGDGEGLGEGELSKSRDIEPAIVVADDKEAETK